MIECWIEGASEFDRCDLVDRRRFDKLPPPVAETEPGEPIGGEPIPILDPGGEREEMVKRRGFGLRVGDDGEPGTGAGNGYDVVGAESSP